MYSGSGMWVDIPTVSSLTKELYQGQTKKLKRNLGNTEGDQLLLPLLLVSDSLYIRFQIRYKVDYVGHNFPICSQQSWRAGIYRY